MVYSVLIIEDDHDINALLAAIFEREGWNVQQTFSGTEGLCAFTGSEDLILLDLMLPGLAGEEVLKTIRSRSEIPVMVISGRSELDDKVDLLRAGADDYLTKPFEKREVLARAEALLRRFRRSAEPPLPKVIEAGPLRLSEEGFEAFCEDCRLDLTQTEFALLKTLMQHPSKAFSRDELYHAVWGGNFMGDDNTVNVHISHLRTKLKEISGREYILTVWGIGYRLSLPSEP